MRLMPGDLGTGLESESRRVFGLNVCCLILDSVVLALKCLLVPRGRAVGDSRGTRGQETEDSASTPV